jgi:hypothetical protein
MDTGFAGVKLFYEKKFFIKSKKSVVFCEPRAILYV